MPKLKYFTLKEHIEPVIDKYQSCGLPNRNISTNIKLIRDICDITLKKKQELFILSLDQQKAFDSIRHDYLDKVIEETKIPDELKTKIKLLYKNTFAFIEVNKSLTDTFEIQKGVKQGCCMSMLLYILAINKLLIKINGNPNIKGYEFTITKHNKIKILAYADDTCIILKDRESIRLVIEHFEEWGGLSGANLNKEKSSLLILNPNEQYKSNFDLPSR